MSHRLALFPGSFDPFTLGHLDIVRRAAALFDEVEITVAVNRSKAVLFGVAERVDLISACTSGLSNVRVVSFEGLLAERVHITGACAVVRGIRQIADFEYESRMAFANRKLVQNFETVFLLPSQENIHIHASIVREIVAWGGDVTAFVPQPVAAALAIRAS